LFRLPKNKMINYTQTGNRFYFIQLLVASGRKCRKHFTNTISSTTTSGRALHPPELFKCGKRPRISFCFFFYFPGAQQECSALLLLGRSHSVSVTSGGVDDRRRSLPVFPIIICYMSRHSGHSRHAPPILELPFCGKLSGSL